MMNRTRLTRSDPYLIMIMAVSVMGQSRNEPVLMPMPAQLQAGEGKLAIDSNFGVAIKGSSDARLQRAALRFLKRLSEQTGIPITLSLATDTAKSNLQIHCATAGEEILTTQADESYTLEISAQSAMLSAENTVGAMRGLETFLQWVTPDTGGFSARGVKIQDRPRFPWRGLLIDACRHWQPVDVILRNLDAMAAVKMNVLHWHLSEDQGFRVESKRFPRLHQMGSDGKYYTQEEIRSVIEYARDRGIRVVPEFDMPGHSTSWFVGHPELASAPGPYQIERAWGIFDPCMDPAKEETYTFLDRFIGEMAALFPDPYFHIGGDEVNGIQWNSNTRIQAFKRERGMKDNHDLQAYFNKRVQAILTKYGKKMVGWDEVLHPDLPRDVVVHSWRGQDSLAKAARDGFSGLLSFGYYLDHILPASSHYAVDPMDKSAATLTGEQKARILGGEACMWAEFVTPENIDSRIWPRGAAVAERLWSPAAFKDTTEMYRRLESVSRHLERAGSTHRRSYTPMLERIAGNAPVEALRTLSDVLEPVKLYERSQTRKYTSLDPLNRLVDATRPESDRARELSNLVDRFLAGGTETQSAREALRFWLHVWSENHLKLRDSLQGNIFLMEVEPLSEDLSTLGRIGLQALDHLSAKTQPSASWRSEQIRILERAAKPRAELLLMPVAAVHKLVDAAASTR